MVFSYFIRKRFGKDKCLFKDTLKAFDDLKKSKKLYEVIFFDM